VAFGIVREPKDEVTSCPDKDTSCSDIPVAVPCEEVIDNPEG
jgi:hypothetical protein